MSEISRRQLSATNGDHLRRTGTEWLPEKAVNRAALRPSQDLAQEANRRIVKTPSEVRQARAGDVVLLKGVHFGSGSAPAAVHRSPPIERQGATRVVLVATACRSDSKAEPLTPHLSRPAECDLALSRVSSSARYPKRRQRAGVCHRVPKQLPSLYLRGNQPRGECVLFLVPKGRAACHQHPRQELSELGERRAPCTAHGDPRAELVASLLARCLRTPRRSPCCHRRWQGVFRRDPR